MVFIMKATETLRQALRKEGKVSYRANGCREISGEDFLEQALEAARKIGITRVAKLSELIDVGYPVYQATRPNIWDHTGTGMNTGSQGKGSTVIQALLSCLSECIESYAMEPRNPFFIRATFNQLSRAHRVIDPRFFVRSYNCPEISPDEPLLWGEAYCPPLDSAIWTPAESLYYPVSVSAYQTRSAFPRGFNGFAAGTSYLDASIHGLYELLERNAMNGRMEGKCLVHLIDPASFPLLSKVKSSLQGDFSVRLFLVQGDDLPKMPVFQCQIRGPLGVLDGWGCCLDFDIAAERAISEAIQCYATVVSGSREDAWHAGIHRSGTGTPMHDPIYYHSRCLYEQGEQSLKVQYLAPRKAVQTPYEQARAVSGHQRFETLQEEFQAIQTWLADAGYPVFLIMNATPEGIDIPAVRVCIPQMRPAPLFLQPYHYTRDNIVHFKYRNIFTSLDASLRG